MTALDTPNSLQRSMGRVLLAVIAVCGSVMVGPQPAQAQAQSPDQAEQAPGIPVDSSYVERVVVGHGGTPKLGHWTPIFIYPAADNSFADSFRVQAVDGDQMPIVYSGPLSVSNRGERLEAWTRMGRNRGSIRLQLLKSGERVDTIEIPLQDGVLEFESSTLTRLLTIATGNEIPELIKRNLTAGVNARDALVTNLDSLDELSDHWFCLQNIKTMVLFVDAGTVPPSQKTQAALMKWMENGGHLIFSIAPDLAAGSLPNWLERLFPWQVTGTTQMTSSSSIESFTSSDQQLIEIDGSPITAVKTEPGAGVVVLKQGQLPLIIRDAVGFGQVTFVTIDLGSQRLQNWKGYKNLLRRLVDDSLGSRPDVRENKGSRVSHSGYQDLVGQLRIPLDQFARVKFVTFTLVAVLIAIYILCIGPGDYFLLRRLIGKMELTWVTFLLFTLAFCGVAWFTAGWAKPDAIQVNQLELIDIDAESGKVRGNLWVNLYSPVTESQSIGIEDRNGLSLDIQQNLVTWQGLPGSGLGGMQSRAVTQFEENPYECRLQETAPDETRMSLQELPIQVSSSKQIFGQWWSNTEIANKSRLGFNPRLQRLEGTFANPFDRRLTNCRLFFQNSVYVMNRPLEPNEYVDVASDAETTEKAIRVHLSRRRASEERKDRSTSAPWNPASTNLRRIADMLMFYEAAGGFNYTKLTHDYQSFVDLSRQLDVNRAILVGELSNRVTNIEINGSSPGENYDKTLTVVRLVLPVLEKTRN